MTLNEIDRQAKALGSEDRTKLAESPLDSLHAADLEVEAEWSKEIEDRVAAFDGGEMQSYAAEEVLAKARRMTET
ncbi:MAG TPA: addiction module protein [Planctomycetia bacterium]|nr:addiction module protein [Planctomycetia bacterium]